MSIDRKLLEILCCPATKVPVQRLSRAKLEVLNEQITQAHIKYADGSAVDSPLSEGLITETGTTIYRVDDGIPVMLEDKGIPTSQVQGF